MTKVVIDTNVFVSSYFGGYPASVIDLWKEAKIHICLCNEIIEEYVLVLARMGHANDAELEELVNVFRHGEQSIFTFKTPTISVCEDPDDNKFIETAVELKASYIISGDKHLLSLENYMGIRIVKAKEFVEIANSE
jgi:putative PIN family toxin of toxin-antitoxin system